MKTLTVIDDFSKHAPFIRHMALQQPACTFEFMGHKYPGIIRDAGFESMLLDHLGPLIAFHGGFQTIYPVLSFFRVGVAADNPEIYIHADSAIGAQYAAVFYLNLPEQCRGGTAFWTHRATGWTRLPKPEELKEAGWNWDQDFCDRLNREGASEDNWTMNGLVSMQWNRMILYPGDLFHSRYPKDYVGEKPCQGRLVWVCFFNLTAPPK